MIVPTGVGASIGGFAGDANPVCKQLAKVSDYLITHPNVVNGAIFTDIPDNVIVVEGALLDLFFENKIALRPNIHHKIAIVVDKAADQVQREITENCINAAKHFYGIDLLPEIFYTEEFVDVKFISDNPADDILENQSRITASTDLAKQFYTINNKSTLLKACSQAIDGGATALALLTVIPEQIDHMQPVGAGHNLPLIQIQKATHDYLEGRGHDPIGKIEAEISHLVSREFLIPSAHAPIFNTIFKHQGLVHPKVAAEHLGLTYLPSVLKCLEHSAGILVLDDSLLDRIGVNVADNEKILHNHRERLRLNELVAGDISVVELSNLVVPYDSCNGIPMRNAHKFNVQLLTVKDNATMLNETAESLGLKHKIVDNYLEAAQCLVGSTQTRKLNQ